MAIPVQPDALTWVATKCNNAILLPLIPVTLTPEHKASGHPSIRLLHKKYIEWKKRSGHKICLTLATQRTYTPIKTK